MKIINPIGREVQSNTGNQPKACMCNTSAAHASARGSGGCFTCGYHCGNDVTVTSGNSSTAFWTVRR